MTCSRATPPQRMPSSTESSTRQYVYSDRGTQYASADYIKALADSHIVPSMTESGNPKDNAMAERINNTVKNELLQGKTFASPEKVTEAVERAVLFYNLDQPQDTKVTTKFSKPQGVLKPYPYCSHTVAIV